VGQTQKLEKLFRRYIKDECSGEEVQLLMHYFNANENTGLLKYMILKELESSSPENAGNDPETKTTLDELLNKIRKKIRKKDS
jgi:hypothetical protein